MQKARALKRIFDFRKVFSFNQLVFQRFEKVLLNVIAYWKVANVISEKDVQSVLVVKLADVLIFENIPQSLVLNIVISPPIQIDEHNAGVEIFRGLGQRESVENPDVVVSHVGCRGGGKVRNIHAPKRLDGIQTKNVTIQIKNFGKIGRENCRQEEAKIGGDGYVILGTNGAVVENGSIDFVKFKGVLRILYATLEGIFRRFHKACGYDVKTNGLLRILLGERVD